MVWYSNVHGLLTIRPWFLTSWVWDVHGSWWSYCFRACYRKMNKLCNCITGSLQVLLLPPEVGKHTVQWTALHVLASRKAPEAAATLFHGQKYRAEARTHVCLNIYFSNTPSVFTFVNLFWSYQKIITVLSFWSYALLSALTLLHIVMADNLRPRNVYILICSDWTHLESIAWLSFTTFDCLGCLP